MCGAGDGDGALVGLGDVAGDGQPQPGAAGLAVITVWQFRRPECTYSKKACMTLLAAACGVILVIGLVQGVPALLAGLGV